MSVIIIGAGDVGLHLAKKLVAEKKDVLVIEKEEKKIRRLTDEINCKAITGSGSNPAVLNEAGVEKAEMLIAVTDSDEVNITACTLASLQSHVPIKIARVRQESFSDPEAQAEFKIDKLGIDLIINPERQAAEEILNILTVPGAVEILKFLDDRVRLIGAKVTEKCSLLGIPFEELSGLRQELNILVAAIFRDQQFLVPKGQDVLKTGDLIYYISVQDNAPKIMQYLGHSIEPVKRVMIDGGGKIGLDLAKNLEKEGVSVKIVESDSQRCSVLIRNLDKAVVLNGTATDQDLLNQENIKNMDAFVAVTGDDENNILSSLLAKRLGAPWVITLANQTAYVPLVTTIGVDVVINPRLLAAGAILQYVRRGKVLSVASLRDEIELIEVEALESSELVEKKVKDIDWPEQSLALALQRGEEVIIPTGETMIYPHDKVLLFAAREAIPKIEKLLAVKLEYF
ncbi:MAG: Trk system potassium transporter TrkA [Deltaproteobacteria bacterium]|nr:Trk system potassium transporter TrkA [Deltaproteobacteria bacterium]